MDEVAVRIFQLLEKSGMEQTTFAEVLGVAPSVISKWKSGGSRSYLKYLRQIAELLNTTVFYLMYGELEPVVSSFQMQRLANAASELSLDQFTKILNAAEKKDPTIVSDDEAALNQELISRLVQLTPEELEKVDAFVQGLLAGR